jgi:alpha-mannosidase
MKRRDLLKSLTLAAGRALCPNPSWGQAEGKAEDKDKPKLATPIRALTRKNGILFQPLQMNVENPGSAGTAVIKLDGVEIDRRTLQSGASKFDLYLKPVTGTRTAIVVVELNGQQQTAQVELKPVRQIQIYVLPHSHHDLGYTDLQADVEEKQILNITKGIELARKTADYPEGARFVWNLEVLWGADLYMKRKSESARQEFIDAVRKGWIGITDPTQMSQQAFADQKNCFSFFAIQDNLDSYAKRT